MFSQSLYFLSFSSSSSSPSSSSSSLSLFTGSWNDECEKETVPAAAEKRDPLVNYDDDYDYCVQPKHISFPAKLCTGWWLNYADIDDCDDHETVPKKKDPLANCVDLWIHSLNILFLCTKKTNYPGKNWNILQALDMSLPPPGHDPRPGEWGGNFQAGRWEDSISLRTMDDVGARLWAGSP